MLICMDNVERVSHAAARMRYHHDSDTQTIVAYVCGLQSSCERWTVPTTMDGRGAVGRGIEIKSYRQYSFTSKRDPPVPTQSGTRVFAN